MQGWLNNYEFCERDMYNSEMVLIVLWSHTLWSHNVYYGLMELIMSLETHTNQDLPMVCVNGNYCFRP